MPEEKKVYNLDFMDRAIMAAFDNWLKANPKGGLFEYHGHKLQVTPIAKQH